MFRVAALVPSPPLLVPELAGRAADRTADLRASALRAAADLGSRADRWIALGVDRTARVLTPDSVGTFQGFGADVLAPLSAHASNYEAEMPLAALVAGWLGTNAAPSASVEVRVYDRAMSATASIECGTRLRSEIETSAVATGLLVIGDGANTLTAKAPGAFDPRAPELQSTIDAALAAGNLDVLKDLDADECREVGVDGRVVWQMLAGVFGAEGGPQSVQTLYSGAPFGVGYHVGIWLP